MSKNKIKKAKKNGSVAKVPVVIQLEALECGAASLAMVMAYYGRWITLEQLREDCGISRDGSSAKSILRAARGHKMTANAYRLDTEGLKEHGTFPCIIHWEFDHFVVLDGFKKGNAYINDPARGEVCMPIDEFDDAYSGVCMFFEPTEEFEPKKQEKSVIGYIIKSMRGMTQAIIFVLLVSVTLSLAEILINGSTRFFMDELLTEKNIRYANSFFVLASILVLTQIFSNGIRDVNMLRIRGRIEAYGSCSFLWKVLHLPMRFFSQRLAGDIHMRQQLHANIATKLMNSIAPLFLNLSVAIFYLVVMSRYSTKLMFISVGGILLNTAIAGLIAKKRINITRVLMRDEGVLEAATVSGIEMMDTIKASGAEDGFFKRWSGYQAALNVQNVRMARQDAYFGMVPVLVSEGVDAAVIILSVWLMMNGLFTAGMLLAFQGLTRQFMRPAGEIVDVIQEIQELKTQIERIEDVMEYPDDPAIIETDIDDEAGEKCSEKLSGNLSINNITFGYAKYADPLIKDFSLELKRGQSVALVGSSGCGKSTIANLVTGLYAPWSGEILFDGKKVSEIDHGVFTSSVAMVDQEIIMFEDTIENNIKMWDRTIENFEAVLAARDASVHEDIMRRDGGYKHMLAEGGTNLSGGQRQRMEIARVLAQDPTILIMDEATSALDAITEAKVMKAVRDRGITLIIIAHRLSTIRDCDEIIVLDRGDVVQRGTHEKLMAEGGFYKELVTNE